MLPKVLVVEDDDSIRGLLVTALRREALHVDAASDGAKALELCAASEYAVILLDLMMPILNGFDFLDAFTRATPPARSVVLAVTAFDDPVVARLTWPQVHAIVKKPFDVEQLVTTVREVAAIWSAEAGTSSQSATPLDAMQPPTDSAC